MIVSKAALQAIEIVKSDNKIPMLNNLRIEADGTVIAFNGRALLAIEPVKEEIVKKLPIYKERAVRLGLTISAETVREILKNMPKDTLFGGLLEYCRIDPIGVNKASITISDGRRGRIIEAKLYDREYFDWRKLVSDTLQAETAQRPRAILNRKRINALLNCIEKICPDSTGESPIFVEFKENFSVVFRSINQRTGQSCVGVMNAYRGAEGKWMDGNNWEKGLIKRADRIKVKKK